MSSIMDAMPPISPRTVLQDYTIHEDHSFRIVNMKSIIIDGMLGILPKLKWDQAIQLCFDLTALDYLSSIEIGHLLLIQRKLNDSGGSLSLINANSYIGEIFHCLGLDTVLNVRNNDEFSCTQELSLLSPKSRNTHTPEKRLSLLHIDPDPSFQLFVTEIFQHFEHHVTCIDNGRDALRYLHAHHYDAVICDENTPGLDGFSFAKEVKSKSPTRNTPVIFLATQDNPLAYLDAKSIGIDFFMTKDQANKSLVGIVLNMLEID